MWNTEGHNPGRFLSVILCTIGVIVPALFGQDGAADEALILHYGFDADPASVAKDLSPHGHDGQIVKGQYLDRVEGRQGVLRFDGRTSYIDCGESDSLRLEGDMTLIMWVRLHRPLETGSAMIFGDDAGHHFFLSTARASWQIPEVFTLAETDDLLLWYRHQKEPMILPLERSILSEDWSHFAVVVAYPRCRFYHNGALIRDAYMPIPGIVEPRSRPKQIGGVRGRFCPMDLDEFRLYRRALSAREIAAHAQGQEPVPAASEELAVEAHWYERSLTLRLSCQGAEYRGHGAEFSVHQGDGRAAAPPQRVPLTEVSPGSRRYVAEVSLPLSGLENSALDGVARVIDPDGETIKTIHRHAHLRQPDWVRSREGYTEQAPAPWTALSAQSKDEGPVQVNVWGRRYVFGPHLFPQEIASGGADLLTAPIALTGRIGNEAVAWDHGQVRLTQASPTAAWLEQVCESGPTTLRVRTNIEYDGYVTFDCTLEAQRDLTFENLQLRIPLKTQYATLCFGQAVYPGQPKVQISIHHSGAVDGDKDFRFTPNLWIGNEQRGLSWQAESDEHWHRADPQKTIQILQRDGTTTVQANLISTPTSLSAKQVLRYKFALMATPAKPVLRDSWDLRILKTHGRDFQLPDLSTEGPEPEPILQSWAKAGVRRLFFGYPSIHKVWPYPMPRHQRYSDAVHHLVDGAHAQGIALHQYMIHERFPPLAPEFDVHGLHMVSRPMKPYGSRAIRYCAKSMALQDACVHSLARRLDTHGGDGAFLDGTGSIKACRNTAHGCGYRAADGKMRSTYPVFANRKFLQRIYNVIKQRRPAGVVDLHCSFQPNIAALVYADIIWTGEHWYHLRDTGARDGYVSGELPPDMFRTEFMGHPIGVAAELLHYRLTGNKAAEPSLAPFAKLCATSLLHDVPIRARAADTGHFNMLKKLWQVRDDFGAKEAEKLFYWNNQDYVTVAPPKCYATLMKHPTNGVLAIVSNLHRDPQTVNVQLDLDRLGLNGRELDVFNVLTDEPVDMSNRGELSLALESENFIYLWARPAD